MAALLEPSHICTQNLQFMQSATWLMITSLWRPRGHSPPRPPFLNNQTSTDLKTNNWEVRDILGKQIKRISLCWTPVASELTLEPQSRGILASMIDLDSPPRQQEIYNHVCCKTSRAGAGIKMWPATEGMDHRKSALIQCKLEKQQQQHIPTCQCTSWE